MWKERTELLIKKENIEKLNNSNVLVVGIGGVGSYTCEILARAGIGNITIVDSDTIDRTNINRQLLALNSTIGKNKTDVLENRLLDINPNLKIKKITSFINPEDVKELLNYNYNCVVDCIDTIKPKIEFLLQSKKKKIKVISCMGAGGVLDHTKIKSADISKSRDCMLAKKIRKELRKKGVSKGIRVIYSEEVPRKESLKVLNQEYKKSFYGTISYMPSLFGVYAGAEVIKFLIGK